MTLTITKHEDEQRQLKVTVEVPEERVQSEIKKTVRKLSRQIRIPGFRPGKAPYQLVVNRVGGAQAVRSDTVQDMVEPVYREMMAEIEVEPYAMPQVDDVEIEPFVLHVTIPLRPKVVLGDYRSERRVIEPVHISDEAVDEAIERIRERHAIVEPVDRPVAAADIVTLAGTGHLGDDEENKIFNEERFETTLDDDVIFAGTPFVDHIIGAEAGDKLTFSFTFDDEYEDDDLAGKEAHFTLTVLDVKSRSLPDLDDELAKSEGEYETFDELRTATRERLQEQAEAQAKADLVEGMVSRLLEEVEELTYSPAVIESELDDMVEQFKQRVEQIGIEFEDYLEMQNQTVDQLREEWEESAVERIEQRLVLTQFVEAEYLQISAEEFEVEMDKVLDTYGEDEETRTMVRDILMRSGGSGIVNDLLMEKVAERYRVIVAGAAPDLETLAAEAAAQNAGEADVDDDTAEADADDDTAESAESESDADATETPAADDAGVSDDGDDGDDSDDASE